MDVPRERPLQGKRADLTDNAFSFFKLELSTGPVLSTALLLLDPERTAADRTDRSFRDLWPNVFYLFFEFYEAYEWNFNAVFNKKCIIF